MLRSRIFVSMIVAPLFLTGCAATSESRPPIPVLDSINTATAEKTLQASRDSEWAAIAVQFPEVRRPDIQVVRLVTPDEHPQAIADCLVSAGYSDARTIPDGGVYFGTVPAGQEEAGVLARYTCMVQYPIDPVYDQPATESQLRFIYYYWTHELPECLDQFDVPRSDPPSWAVFQEKFGRDGAWDPHQQLVVIRDPSVLDEVIEDCPLFPDEYMGG